MRLQMLEPYTWWIQAGDEGWGLESDLHTSSNKAFDD